ncbi:hypothetical protein EMCG_07044 [[Emmonsia] crescens]|uniref:Uncharacterized protein n=1 Tax=[Emmonsia] crescens TaxID=73230 RepID=A0A0G2JBD2_9EURO|nr:hypothetical protein EMCG_07044 [Emmonsia crescens UAMH 3008]
MFLVPASPVRAGWVTHHSQPLAGYEDVSVEEPGGILWLVNLAAFWTSQMIMIIMMISSWGTSLTLQSSAKAAFKEPMN